MRDGASITEKLQAVQEGDYVRWNGRTRPQPVTSVSETKFLVEGRQGGHYRFQTVGTPELTNLTSKNTYDVEELTVLRPLTAIND